jgi:uroporphyrinogen-III decarboxylase
MSEMQPQPPAFKPSPEFLTRAKRMDDAMHLRKPDRVPVAPLVVTYYATKIKGISNKDAMYIPEQTAEA